MVREEDLGPLEQKGQGRSQGVGARRELNRGMAAVKELQGLRVRCQQWACELRAVPEGQGCLDCLGLSWGWFGVGAEGCLLGGLVGG